MAWTFSRAQGSRGFGTALPGSPVDGDEFTLVDNTTTPTYAWRFRYNAAKASNKWDFIGGAPIYAEVTASETTASLTYVALTTAGPSIAIPVAGDYFVEIGAALQTNTIGDGALMSYDIGATGAVDADAVGSANGTNNYSPNMVRPRKKAGLTAVTLTAKYKATTGGTATFANRWMRVMPIAIGG